MEFFKRSINFNNITKLVIASIVLKIVYLFFAYFTIGNSSTLSIDGYIDITKRNDTGWYEKIATNWYPKITDVKDLGYNNGPDFKQSEWAFFPLYPAMNRVCIKYLNIDFNTSGFFWTLIFSTLAFIGFYKFCEFYLNDSKKALYISLVFMLFPFHYYFSMMYTEAIFFTFLIFSFISIHTGKYKYIPLLIVPLVLIRPNGVIALVPLYFYYLERNGILSKKHFNLSLLLSRRIILQSFLFLSGAIVFLLYCVYQKYMTGYYSAFSIAQAGWYKEFMFPLLALFRRSDFASQFNSVYTIAIILLSVFSWKRFSISLNILIWTTILLPLCSGSVTSMPRYISVIFPISLIIGEWMYSSKIKYSALSLLLVLQLFVFYYWLIYHPFSY
ncbi:MAG: hypothetical protein EHM93_00335 [Bacteroidales bacterium]|nr:MAG: hypothetical protein EHM93_00335 [Bacteroidales bacterium]